jgi:ADP-heptose:LPS heptosyltransferase
MDRKINAERRMKNAERKTTAPRLSIAIIHTGAIGDLVQAAPLLTALRAKWPEARVTLLGRPERGALLRMAGLVDTVVDAETCGLWRLTGDAGDSPPPRPLSDADLVIDFLGLKGLRDSRGVRIEPIPPRDWRSSAAEWLLEQGRAALALPEVSPEPVLAVPQAALDAAARTLRPHGIPRAFVAIHPGSGSVKKNWPLDRFQALAQRIRKEASRRIVWLLGPAEAERGPTPRAAEGETVLAEMPLDTVAAVLTLADAYVGNDSGVTQVAAAVRDPLGHATPTIALFGLTDARVWGPRGPHVHTVRSQDGTMDALSVEPAWSAVRAAIGEAPPREQHKPRVAPATGD